MNNKLWFTLIIIISLLVEIGVFSRYAINLNLSLLLPLIFIGTLIFDWEMALVFALSAGLILDISSLQRFPFWSIFLVFEIAAIIFGQRKIFDLTSSISIIIGVFLITILRIALHALAFHENVFSMQGLYALIANFTICILLIASWMVFRKKGDFLADEKRQKRV